MDIFEYNSNILALNINAHYLHSVQEETNVQYKFIGRDGQTECFTDDSGTLFNIIDQLDETQKMPNRKRREIIFVIGINSLKEIEQLYAQMNPKSYMIVCEPNPEMLAHVLYNKDLELFAQKNISVLACPPEELMPQLNALFSTQLMLLSGNIKIYFTALYRKDLTEAKKVIEVISLVVRTQRWGYGNSIDDCLEGSLQNFQNLKYLLRSKDVRSFKNRFRDKPVIIVSAGPSLEKNIHLLHEVNNKAVIIATETILSRLLQEGIMPHFVTTIERTMPSYEYGYKGKNIPPDVTLIAPPVIKPMIFAEYKGELIIPLRDGIREFMWWDEILNLGEDAFVSMGDSTAHLAFGFAMQVGANPIVLIGQDLAFGEFGTGCHAGGTFYEDVGTNYAKDPMQEPTETVEGYYGGMVTTNRLWKSFKKWFELYIYHLREKAVVINATEGGAKINGAVQMTLKEVIEKYCCEEIPVVDIVREAPKYPLSSKIIGSRIAKAITKIKSLQNLALKLDSDLQKISVLPDASYQQLLIEYKKLQSTDRLWKEILEHNLLFHDMQPEIVHTFYKLYQIEEELTEENIIANIEIQRAFLGVFIFVTTQLLTTMKQTLSEIVGIKERRA